MITYHSSRQCNLSSQQQITPSSADFSSLSSTNSGFELTLTLIITSDLFSVPKTHIDSFWIVKCEISVLYIVCTVHIKQAKLNCTNQQQPQRGDAVPNPVWVGLKWLLAFPRVPVTPGTPSHKPFFRRAAL